FRSFSAKYFGEKLCPKRLPSKANFLMESDIIILNKDVASDKMSSTSCIFAPPKPIRYGKTIDGSFKNQHCSEPGINHHVILRDTTNCKYKRNINSNGGTNQRMDFGENAGRRPSR